MQAKLLLPVGLILISLLVITLPVYARGIYQTNEDFIAEVFGQEIPKSKVVWLKGNLKTAITSLIGHPYKGLRIRYWQANGKTAWILDKIGKERPITFGIVIANQKIDRIKVLAFRESRGYEVRYPAFGRQFIGAKLKRQTLDRDIDGISGATLSVWAMTDMAKLALYLDNHIQP